MTNKWFIAVLIVSVLSGCTKTLDLEAPCHNFGRYCRQYPINFEKIGDEYAAIAATTWPHYFPMISS